MTTGNNHGSNDPEVEEEEPANDQDISLVNKLAFGMLYWAGFLINHNDYFFLA